MKKPPTRSSASAIVRVLFVFLLLLTGVRPVAAQQDIGDTEKRLDELKKLLVADENRLSRTRMRASASQQDLDRVVREIRVREELVTTYTKRQEEMLALQDTLRKSLTLVDDDLERLRKEYRSRASHAYKYGRKHELAMLMASESMTQMLARVRYLKRFSDERRKRLEHIQGAYSMLEEQRTKLLKSYDQTAELIEGAKREQEELARLRSERSDVIKDLRRQERNLEKSISTRADAVRELETRMREIVAAADAKKRSRSGGSASSTVNLTGPFEANKGKLPWPSLGVIREPYGSVVNPVHGTTTPNLGVLIATSPAAEVKSVFDGKIVSVDIMPDLGTYVVVEHGEYHTVYGNFSLLYVGNEEDIKAGQLLGRAGTDATPKGEGIFFAVFKNGQDIDPMPWLGQP
ncbi:MAG: peptidoglycan DD-metalloendopeptidase family protein [Rhodothermales bacterium]|nr:peptidoglycan DD-metalloendopeptidase family protein [Rhodothermales bacterium]